MTISPATAVDLSVPRRTHPASPIVDGLRVAAPAFIGVFLIVGDLADRLPLPRAGIAGIAALALGSAMALGSWIAWARLAFWVDADGDLRVDSGILQRRARQLTLSRLQSIDVVAPLVARLLGLVELRVEVAGSGDSRVVLRYLDRADAERLRSALLARGASTAVAQDPGAQSSDAVALAAVPEGRLLGALVLRTTTVVLAAITAAFVVVTLATQGPAALVVAVVTGGVPLFAVIGEFVSFARFTAERTPQGIRLRHGLIQTQTRTVPPGRVQAVEIVAPLLWRPFGWVRVTLTVAGIGGDGAQVGRAVLLPVAPRREAVAVIGEVLPGVDLDALPWHPVPARARWRSPLQWRILAHAVTPRVFAGRSGRITRRISLAPHARTQSVTLQQGPWQRLLSIATVRVDVAPGPVTVRARNMALDEARPLVEQQCLRSRAARESE